MVEHIKDDLAVDLVKIETDLLSDMVGDDLYSKRLVVNPNDARDVMLKVFTECKEANTKEGLEVCIFTWIEDIFPRHIGGGFKPEREEVFKTINDNVEKIKKDYYYDHAL